MTEGLIPVGEGHRLDLSSSSEMRDSIDVLRLDLGLPSLIGVELMQVDGGEVSPTTDLAGRVARWWYGVSPFGRRRLAMDEASKLPAMAGLGDGEAIEYPTGADADRVCVRGAGSTATSCPASVNADDAAAVVVGESRSTLHSPVSLPMLSQSLSSPSLACTGEQKDGGVGDGVWQPAVVNYGVGGASGEQEVEVGAGRAALVMPTDLVCSSLPSLFVSVVDTVADGFVSEEVRVSPTAREALRPQPTDGLWQPPSSPMEPVSEREEKEKVVYGGVQGSRTYAHVVHADRRADVELSFIPPVDGGNSIS
ncbi:hypothetical protein Dimus_005912, partial [Dionaea muscipula]